MRIVGLGLALGVGLCVAVGGIAHAQSTKGAGKSSVSIIKWPVANIQAKAAGTLAAKPSASIVGKPPTGGTVSSLKLAKDIGQSAKPGFPPGQYVLDIESTAQPQANYDAQGVVAFVTLTVDAAGKCTVHAADSVDGDGINDNCDGLCAPDAVGKCSFTIYQAAGNPNYAMLSDGAPQATRARIRLLTNPNDCATGDIILLGVPVPGSSDCRNAANTVVGIMGVAGGDVVP